ncbi:DUF2474 domain-containing protein [Methylorubrum thiocyanatum]|uniref:DUF2474 domain-containing protein n=1 Tax=Methylorubrum thiocyanatum TaxID=47958 RepID=A0AA40S5Z0_9HYPH|nr:DUF2474 domain-containing protein [Methylorubrum thiocyanatum]MBA8915103.1 hypothetical protein [Methylorubrum thiocyanatum]GJE79507.1 hypothetical protein CJNNKLLH_0833 [Methylorubrum thiocyanatum]
MGITSAPRHPTPLPLWRRLVWFASLWAGSVLSLGIVAGILRTWLKAS